MAQRHLMIAMPAYTGMVHVPTMRSLLSDTLRLAKSGVAITLNDECGSTYLNEARSTCVSMFLKSNCTDLIFVDWDVVWPAGAMQRLLDHKVDVVGGIYPQRTDPIVFNCRTHVEGQYPFDPKLGLIDVLGLHTGFLRISRAAAQKMTDHYREAETFERHGEQIVHLFDRYRIPGTKRMLGDDYSFCQRWVDIGGKCWLDPAFNMGHIGLKMFHGEFAKFTVAKDEAEAA